VSAILTAAAQVFEVHGYAGGTTNRIAVAAGVSIGTLYQYFPITGRTAGTAFYFQCLGKFFQFTVHTLEFCHKSGSFAFALVQFYP